MGQAKTTCWLLPTLVDGPNHLTLGLGQHPNQLQRDRVAPCTHGSLEDPAVAQWSITLRINKPLESELMRESFFIHGKEKT